MAQACSGPHVMAAMDRVEGEGYADGAGAVDVTVNLGGLGENGRGEAAVLFYPERYCVCDARVGADRAQLIGS
jgi:hypothetical protein